MRARGPVAWVLMACLASAAPVLACMNEVIQNKAVDVQKVAKAEDALRKNQLEEAATLAMGAVTNILADSSKGNQTVFRRAQQVLAVTTIRSGAKWGPVEAAKRLPPGEQHQQTYLLQRSPDSAKETSYRWALIILETQLRKDPGNVLLKARTAEAQSWIQDEKHHARSTLDELERKDLMPEPWGYAALARLEHERGFAAGRDIAIERCEKMSKGASYCKAFLKGTPES